MNKTLTVWVGASIIYLYGTVNGVAYTFTLLGEGFWQAVVPRTADDNYLLHLEAYSANGLEGTYDYNLFYGFIAAVTDRTAADVARVKALINKGWELMLDAEKSEWMSGMKGAYTPTDLNRVGHNLIYLVGLLNSYGYYLSVVPKTDWTYADIPTASDMIVYLENLSILRFLSAQEIPSSMDNITYIDANNIEKMLVEVKYKIESLVSGFRHCGAVISGQGVILP